MKYKINLHAHTIFSDGYNSPLRMGMTAKKLGFSALVITDHYRNNAPYSSYNFSLCQDACREVREIIPVILGMEIMVEGAEMLLFGGEAIKIIRGIRIDNRRDCINRGRTNLPNGEKHHKAKLTESDILYIRASPDSQRSLAAQFKVTQPNIQAIRSRKSWRHI